MRRAVAISEAALGPNHPGVAVRLNNLATLLQDAGRPAEAEPLYGQAAAISEAALGPDRRHHDDQCHSAASGSGANVQGPTHILASRQRNWIDLPNVSSPWERWADRCPAPCARLVAFNERRRGSDTTASADVQTRNGPEPSVGLPAGLPDSIQER